MIRPLIFETLRAHLKAHDLTDKDLSLGVTSHSADGDTGYTVRLVTTDKVGNITNEYKVDTTSQYESDGSLVGSFKTEHQTNTAASTGAQGKDQARGGERMLDVIDSQGKTLVRYSYDALKQDTGGTYAGNAVTKTLSGFANFPSGTYRLKVVVLRDFPQLDAHSPHILVNLPFFRKN